MVARTIFRRRVYFTNFTTLGHVTHIDYNIAAIKALIAQQRCYIGKQPIMNLAELFKIDHEYVRFVH